MKRIYYFIVFLNFTCMVGCNIVLKLALSIEHCVFRVIHVDTHRSSLLFLFSVVFQHIRGFIDPLPY